MYKFLPQFARHIFSHRWLHLIGPETADNDHFLQVIELITPRCGQGYVAWLFALINGLEVGRTLDESLSVEDNS